jgi:hypothetical protein
MLFYYHPSIYALLSQVTFSLQVSLPAFITWKNNFLELMRAFFSTTTVSSSVLSMY